MASVDGRKAFKQENPALLCDICKDDGQKKQSEIFCCYCEKRLCTSCKTLHKKFCPTHKTISSTEKSGNLKVCKRHEKEKVQFYCNEHAEVFCRFCKSLRHSNCVIQNVKGLCKDLNIKEFTEETFEHLDSVIERVNNINTQIAEKKRKDEANKEIVKSLRADVNVAIDKYESAYESYQQHWLDTLNNDIIACNNFVEALETQRNLLEDAQHGDSVEHNFISCIKAKQISYEYDILVNDLSNRLVEQPIFLFNDQKISVLSQKLASLCNDADFSSEETNDNVAADVCPKRSFCNLTNMSLIKEIDTKEYEYTNYCFSRRIIGSCFMADDQILLCETVSNKIKLLESDLTFKCDITLHSAPFGIARVDSTMAAVTLSNENIIQLVTVCPGLRFERTIHLSRNCFGIAVHSQKIYVSTSTTETRSKKKENRIEVISLNGAPIKTLIVPGPETVGHLCVNTDASKIFFSCIEEPYVACITADGYMLFKHIGLHQRTLNYFILDTEENILVAASDLRCAYVVKSDGKDRIVLDIDTERLGITTLAFNTCNGNVLFASVYNTGNKLQLYE